jgi:hypothetical protein
MSVDQIPWEAAVRHLFEDAFPYDATGTGSSTFSR